MSMRSTESQSEASRVTREDVSFVVLAMGQSITLGSQRQVFRARATHRHCSSTRSLWKKSRLLVNRHHGPTGGAITNGLARRIQRPCCESSGAASLHEWQPDRCSVAHRFCTQYEHQGKDEPSLQKMDNRVDLTCRVQKGTTLLLSTQHSKIPFGCNETN